MDRLVRFNVLAMSGRAVRGGRATSIRLLLDKTGTITLGNRQATEFKPLHGITEQELADAAQLASLADETPEGRSIVVLAKEKYGIRGRELAELKANFIPFSAQDPDERCRNRLFLGPQGRGGRHLDYLNGPPTAVKSGGAVQALPAECECGDDAAKSPPSPTPSPNRAARRSRSPKTGKMLGVIHLKDIVKGGIRERFAELRRMGIRTVMIHGRQSLDRRRHRGGSRRRRFPRSGHAGGQA